MTAYTSGLLGLFAKNAQAAEAGKMKAYMRNQFDYFGIKSPVRKELVKQYVAENGKPPAAQLEAIVHDLWQCPQRECQYVAMEWYFSGRKQYEEDSGAFIEYLIREKSWWDTVDFLAAKVAGYYFEKFPEQKTGLLPQWINSDYMWLRRSSLLFQLKYKQKTDTALMSHIIEQNLHDNEFFIKKAIGWLLREYGKTNPQWVQDFVAQHKLKALSEKEALRIIKKYQ